MYIDYNMMPSCPVPFSSTDKGELWLLGDYFMLLQRYPLSWNYFLKMKKRIKVSPLKMPIIYPWAMPVFHKIDSEYTKDLPFMVLSVENANYKISSPGDNPEFRKEMLDMVGEDGLGPTFYCMFKDGIHSNFGLYQGKMEREAVLDLFFKMLASQLGTDEKPKLAGTIKDTFGNPATGLAPLA